MNTQQKFAYSKIQTGKNVFLFGSSGTGKSFIVKEFYKNHKHLKRIAVTSTTGISALLIKGSTLHSYLGIGTGEIAEEILIRRIRRNRKALERWKELDLLIIDEVSMLSGKLLDKLNYIAKSIRRKYYPFGGLQLVLSGDLFQLGPVRNDNFCFESKAFEEAGFEVILLEEIFRQKNIEFQKCLNEVRLANLSESSKAMLLSRVDKQLNTEPGILPTRIFSLNIDVDEINRSELRHLLTSQEDRVIQKYKMKVFVDTTSIKNVDKYVKMCPAPFRVTLTLRCQVMLLANLSPTLVNGSRGTVVRFEDELPVVRFLNGVEETVNLYTWKIEEDEETVLTIEQIPLRLAYAITNYKSQGQSLDYAEVDLGNIFTYGQAYTALSRVRTLEGLSIRNLNFSSIRANPKVLDYYNKIKSNLSS